MQIVARRRQVFVFFFSLISQFCGPIWGPPYQKMFLKKWPTLLSTQSDPQVTHPKVTHVRGSKILAVKWPTGVGHFSCSKKSSICKFPKCILLSKTATFGPHGTLKSEAFVQEGYQNLNFSPACSQGTFLGPFRLILWCQEGPKWSQDHVLYFRGIYLSLLLYL